MYPVTEKEVTEIVSGCKSKTSYGHDEISMKTVKHVIKQIVRPLTYIFNISLITGIFPNDMKTANVIPVFKSGDRLQFSNYIPISLLRCYGIRGLALDWIKSYLANRSQYVCYNNSNSELKNIKCGVPQGSNLGPVLFILYINDVCEVSKLLNIILFADDTSILYSTRNIVDIAC